MNITGEKWMSELLQKKVYAFLILFQLFIYNYYYSVCNNWILIYPSKNITLAYIDINIYNSV